MSSNLARSIELLATLATFAVLAAGLILGGGSLKEKVARSRSVATRWVVYTFLDCGLIALSIGLVAIARALNASFSAATAAMFIFDLLAAGLLWWLCLRSGQDLTLGREYRRSTDLLRDRAQWAGAAALLLLIAKSIVWDGPERVVEYFHLELEGRRAMAVGLLGSLALLQALFWTGLYWAGFETISTTLS